METLAFQCILGFENLIFSLLFREQFKILPCVMAWGLGFQQFHVSGAAATAAGAIFYNYSFNILNSSGKIRA